jgi:hypothetical protein
MKSPYQPPLQPPCDEKKTRHEAIGAYAAEMAGTDLDLDCQLESAGIEYLVLSAALDLD